MSISRTLYTLQLLFRGCCMKHSINVAVRISILKSEQNYLYTYFYDIVTVIY
jgi:hypothetical protein